MRHFRWSRPSHERGQALAEFAMIAPLLIILIFGIIDIARAYNGWVTVQGAARQGARYAVTGRSECAAASPSREACIEHTAREYTTSLTNSATSIDVDIRSWEYPDYAGSATDDSAGDQCDAVEVEVTYEFKAATPMFESLFGPITISGRERMVNEPFGACDA
jgi:Flp pilus assembly protein TadG